MADITTSIAITADASKAIAEMQRVTTTVENLAAEQVVITPQVNAQGIADFKQTISGAISIPVTTTMADGGMTQQIVDAKNQIQNSQSIINGLLVQQEATTGRIAAAEANVVASKAAQVSTAAQTNTETNKQAKTAERLNEILESQKQKREQILAILQKMRSAKASQIREEMAAGKEDSASRAAETLRNLEAQGKVQRNSTAAIKEGTTAVGGFRAGINDAARAYERFSTGKLEKGFVGLRSISLNIISDMILVKQVAETALAVGMKIGEVLIRDQNALANAVQRTLSQTEKTRMQFIKMGIEAKDMPAYIDAITKKIDELNQKILEPNTMLIGATQQMQVNWEELNKQREKERQANTITKQDYEKLLAQAKELQKQEKQRALERLGLPLLKQEEQLKAKIAMDIADLEMQLFIENDEEAKKLLEKRIDIRKKLGEKELSDFKKDEEEKKKQEQERIAEETKRKNEEAKREMDRIRGIADEARNAEIANLDERARIDEKYKQEAAAIQRRLDEAKTAEERQSIRRIFDARKKARDIELDEYQKRQKKIAEDIAADAKQKQIEAANLQRSQLEDIANYQRQLVNQFSGLQGSVFPKEALQLLRTIANNGSIR